MAEPEYDQTLQVFEGDTLLDYVRRTERRWILKVLPAIFLLAMLLAAATADRVAMHSLGTAICQDAGRLLLDPDWACLKRTPVEAQFPLLRDWPSVVVALILGYTPHLVFMQWSGLRNLLTGLQRRNLVRYSSDRNKELFRQEIQAANGYFHRRGRSGLVSPLVTLILLLTPVVALQGGVYSRISPYGRDGTWEAEAYSNWWASFNGSSGGWMVYMLIGFIGLYYVATMNIIGSRAVLILWRTRDWVEFDIDLDNLDGYYGWRDVRTILTATYQALILHAFAILLLATALPSQNSWLLAPVLLLWLVVAPVYTLIPLRLVGSTVRHFKSEQIVALVDQIEAETDEHRHDLLVARLERVRSVPNFIFRSARDRLIIGFTVVAGLASIVGALALWYA